ncbi:acyltransferase family protein [Corynebacterium terpenotabidum]|uniref:acyltransferase family protein n=1 Tax=Corynebacterium terpenotabidum TaxID=89154 RepID=UPI000424781B|nr:acyltransferase family protein [Corynebacterium terpenotabidum]
MSSTGTPAVNYGRVGWVDAAKGLCILLVVAGHAIISLNGHGYATGVWEDINLIIGPVRMPLFFLLSGLFAAKALTESWRRFADRRIWVMLWLLVLWVPIREIWLALIPRTTVGAGVGDGVGPEAPAAVDPANWVPMLQRMAGRSSARRPTCGSSTRWPCSPCCRRRPASCHRCCRFSLPEH